MTTEPTQPNLSPQAEVIYNLVRSARVGTTLSEIEQALTFAGHDPHGELGMRATAWINVYMWTNVNADFIRWMHELTGPDLVHFHPTSPLIYAYDGAAFPGIPVAHKIPELGGGFDEAHWLPVVVNFGPPSDGQPPALPMASGTPHALYRFYALDGTLLYVGLTMDPGTRFKTHSKQKPWWFDVKDIRIERFPSREAVEVAERAAIIAEHPIHNIVHNRRAIAA